MLCDRKTRRDGYLSIDAMKSIGGADRVEHLTHRCCLRSNLGWGDLLLVKMLMRLFEGRNLWDARLCKVVVGLEVACDSPQQSETDRYDPGALGVQNPFRFKHAVSVARSRNLTICLVTNHCLKSA